VRRHFAHDIRCDHCRDICRVGIRILSDGADIMILTGDIWDHFGKYGFDGWTEYGGGNTGIHSNECKELCKDCQLHHPNAIVGAMSVRAEPHHNNRNYLIIYKEVNKQEDTTS